MGGDVIASAAHAARSAATGAGGAAGGAARRSLTLEDVAKLDSLVGGLAPAEQLRIGRNLLADERVRSSPIVRGPLAAIRMGLMPVQTPEVGAATILKRVRDNLDLEIRRIDGEIPSGGLDGHPNYATVGGVRSDLDLLEALKVI